MSELAFTLLRFAFLGLLWVFVFSIVGVLRTDLFGTTVKSRGQGRAPAPRAASPLPPPPSRSTPGPLRRLLVTQGPLAGTSIPLVGTSIVVGRSPAATLVLDDDYASGRHARFYPTDDAWFVEDLNSTNGTLVNGHPIQAPTPVELGTVVRIGQTAIELRR
ncbi:FHA domain-containing protein FhaB/FipA [Buchananella hordeovulneris]|uniref:FHA domain-containing protein n=1 Tax=Buchananella hordeovulneris TaxID=52770 RepID=A0A1Q5PV44_9ACTO|nr:FHA domain-containing protein [Buchananella hordeovulneris]MDO5081700.1 FHA domain-containing protein [Buchananella hordeovulneris]OKL51290.1 hypothetical protein BSZ40_08245 [Buchananella hordeovulneris]RRD52114.1 FHA domain-containing protein [Buchananella hordeovulneris]